MLSAKQGHYWYHFLWYDAVLDWGLNPGPPELEDLDTMKMWKISTHFTQCNFTSNKKGKQTELQFILDLAHNSTQ